MAETVLEPDYIEVPDPDISHIITEDDKPVDNIFSEKQQRLLTESLNSSWKPDRPFVAAANVGIFYGINQPAIVPDMFLSLDVELPENIWKKRHRSYFVWEYGKAPDLVVEVVSNTQGGETDAKFRIYEKLRAWYYIVFDPQKFIQKDVLRIYELSGKGYIPKIDRNLSLINLGVTLWQGDFERRNDLWLRWTDIDGNLIPTGFENAEIERCRADEAEKKADKAQKDAEKAEAKARLLEEKLRSLGIDPGEI